MPPNLPTLSSPRSWPRHGLTSGDSAKIARAVPLIESLHAANPTNPAITRLLARVYVDTGKPDLADPLYASLVSGQLSPDPTLVTDYADLLIRQHRPAEAEKLLKQALAKPHSYPTPADMADAALHLACAAQDIDDPKTALQALALSATVQPPLRPAPFLEKGATADEALHQSTQAVAAYKRFLAASAGKYPEQGERRRANASASPFYNTRSIVRPQPLAMTSYKSAQCSAAVQSMHIDHLEVTYDRFSSSSQSFSR